MEEFERTGGTVPLRLLDCLGLLVTGLVLGPKVAGLLAEGGEALGWAPADETAGGMSKIADGEGILISSIPTEEMRT